MEQLVVPDGGLADLVVDDQVWSVVFGEGRPGSRDSVLTTAWVAGHGESESSHKKSQTGSILYVTLCQSSHFNRLTPFQADAFTSTQTILNQVASVQTSPRQ